MPTNFFKFFEKNFGILLLTFAVLSFFIPTAFDWAKNLTDEMLMVSLFLGFLKIDFKEIFHLRNNIGKMIFFVLQSLILIPVTFYFITPYLDNDVRIGVFLLIGVSGALMAPLLASVFKLKVLWSAVFTIFTSVLMPFTLPFLVKAFFGISFEIDIFTMMIFLMKIIFIPLISAIICKHFFPKLIKKTIGYYSFIGILLTICFLGALIANNQETLSKNILNPETIPTVLILIATTFSRYLIGFLMPAADKQEKWTNSFMFGTTNNGIVILFAAQFFPEKVLFVLLLSEIPWITAQPIFQKLIQTYYQKPGGADGT